MFESGMQQYWIEKIDFHALAIVSASLTPVISKLTPSESLFGGHAVA